jgi:serine/threonine protein kinase
MQIGRYELLGKIGEGAHGVVYLATDPKLGREVAIKALQPDLAGDESVQNRFRREMRSIAKLKHPNIIELVDFSDPDAEWPYLVMERLHGETLLDLISRMKKPLTPVAAAAAAHEICLALEHAHEQGIVHRDLKPENVFLEPNGRIVLCDFGIAVGFLGEENTLSGKNTKLLGSPLYMSPEQILADSKTGPPSDLFALGSCLYFLVTGEHAFAEESILGVLKRISLGAAKALPPEIANTRLGTIISKLLKANLAERYQSADEVAEALATVISEGGEIDPRRALKKALAELTNDAVRITAITAIENLDASSRTLITKVAKGKPRDWSEVTDAGGGEHTSIVDLSQLRSQQEQADGQTHTEIRTVGAATAKPRRTEPSPLWVVGAVIASLAIIGLVVVLVWPQKQAPPLPAKVEPLPELPGTVPELPPTPNIEKPPVVPEMPAAPEDPRPRPQPQTRPVPVVRKEAPGTLRVIAKPWAYIFIDGIKVGQTPSYREATLSPGKHTLRFENPDFATVTRSVEIQGGEETKLKVDLENP